MSPVWVSSCVVLRPLTCMAGVTRVLGVFMVVVGSRAPGVSGVTVGAAGATGVSVVMVVSRGPGARVLGASTMLSVCVMGISGASMSMGRVCLAAPMVRVPLWTVMCGASCPLLRASGVSLRTSMGRVPLRPAMCGVSCAGVCGMWGLHEWSLPASAGGWGLQGSDAGRGYLPTDGCLQDSGSPLQGEHQSDGGLHGDGSHSGDELQGGGNPLGDIPAGFPSVSSM